MTTGSRVVDLRTLVSTSCGNSLVGSYFSKTWSGVDYPATPPSYAYVDRYRYARLPLSLVKGFSLTPRKPEYYRYIVKKRVRVKGPRRSTTVDHPYTCSWVNFYDPLFSWGFSPTSLTLKGTMFSCFGGVSVDGSTWTANDDLALLGKLREKVAGSSFQAGVFLAEGKQACAMIGDAAVRIATAYSAARKGNFSKASRILTQGRTGVGKDGVNRIVNMRSDDRLTRRKTAANNWLELQYGWLPLLQDAYEGAQFLAQHLEAPLVHKFRVRYGRPCFPKVGTTVLGTKEGRISGQIIAKLTEKQAVLMNDLKDPASIAWELMPYSFVVDWFVPIGSYLASRSLAQALTGNFVKTITLKYRVGNCSAFGSGYYGSSASFKYEAGTVTRTVSTSLSIPLPESKGLEKAASWRHCVNAVSLLLQKSSASPELLQGRKSRFTM